MTPAEAIADILAVIESAKDITPGVISAAAAARQSKRQRPFR